MTVPKATPEPRRPYHVGVAIGLTTGAYAISLMAASTLQIQHDRAVMEDRAPVVLAITVLSDRHDDMRTRLEMARARYAVGAEGYGALITRLDAMRARLTAMDRTVTAIERANGALAAGIPGVPSRLGHSGSGSTASSSGSRGSGTTAPRTVPAAPPPVAKPPTSGSTGASGKP